MVLIQLMTHTSFSKQSSIYDTYNLLKKKLDAWYDGKINPSHLPPALHMHANNHDLSHANNQAPSFIDGSE